MGQEIDKFTVFIVSEVDIFFCCLTISLFSIFLMLLCNVFLTFSIFLLSYFSTFFFLPLSFHLHHRLQLSPPFLRLPASTPTFSGLCVSQLSVLPPPLHLAQPLLRQASLFCHKLLWQPTVSGPRRHHAEPKLAGRDSEQHLRRLIRPKWWFGLSCKGREN